MKRERNVVHGLIACVIALAMVASAAAQTMVQGTAKVVRMKGEARYGTGDASGWRLLKVGTVLKPGTIVQTDKQKGSYVDLVLGDGEAPVPRPAVFNPNAPPAGLAYQPKAEQNTIRLFENTALGIDKLVSMQTGADVVSETQLDLRSGHVLGNVKKMSAASKYEIKLPNGVAGIRGTIYDIYAEGIVKVLVGSVVYAYVGGDGAVKTQVVSSAQQFDATTGVLSPISESAMSEIRAIVREMQIVMPGVIETYSPDKTIRPGSPHGGSSSE